MKFTPIRTMMIYSLTEIFVGDIPIPANALIGEDGKELKYVLTGMNAGQVSEGLGPSESRAVVHCAGVSYARERVAFGRPVGVTKELSA